MQNTVVTSPPLPYVFRMPAAMAMIEWPEPSKFFEAVAAMFA